MTVTIFGATGMVGKQLITHSLAKGWQVRAFGRNVESLIDEDLRTENLQVIKGYVLDEHDVRHAIAGSNAVLSALGGAFDGTDKTRSLGIKNIIGQMLATGVQRIVALGGLGVLPDAEGKFRLESPGYPKQYLPVGLEHKQAYQYLENAPLLWTFVCAPDILPEDADGKFGVAAEQPGPSFAIKAGNLAQFMVEEAERNQFVHHRVGIGNK
jgi:putative NADH-flavin reductase